MSLKKDVKEIKEVLNEVTHDAIIKSKKYDDLIGYLKHIKLDVKSVSMYPDEVGSVGIKIDYAIPSVKIVFDSDGSIIKNNRLVAINMLNLISLEDMKKIQDKIEEANRINKK